MKTYQYISCICRKRGIKVSVLLVVVIFMSFSFTFYLNSRIKTVNDGFLEHEGQGVVQVRDTSSLSEYDTDEPDYVDVFQDQLIHKKEVYHAISGHTCRERRNFVFIKTMKCATQTVTQILRRFGYIRHLNFVLPRKQNIYIGWPYIPETIDYRPSHKTFNALAEHAIFNATVMTKLMPKDTAFFTILREPFSQFKSAFHYFNFANISKVKGPDHITEYLNNIAKYEVIYKSHEASPTRYCIPDGFSITKNLLAHCMGMPLGFPHGRHDISGDAKALTDYIQTLDENFDVVLLMEYFPESLVLLKRVMCWSLRDMIYLSRNIGDYSYKKLNPSQHKLESIYRKWSPIDYQLYDHFNKTFWRKVQEYGTGFFAEVKQFENIQTKVTEFCADVKSGEATFQISASEFNEQFVVNANFCYLLGVDLLTHLKTRYDREEGGDDTKENNNSPKRGC